MEAEITEVSLEPCIHSKFVVPFRVNFKQVSNIILIVLFSLLIDGIFMLIRMVAQESGTV